MCSRITITYPNKKPAGLLPIIYNYTYSTDGKYLLTAYRGQACEYDSYGNPTTYKGKTLVWGQGKRLLSYDGLNFTYDARGRRIQKGSESYYYDSRDRLVRGGMLDYYYADNEVISCAYNGVRYIYCKDVFGNITAILDENESVVVKYDYDAWGNHRVLNNAGAVITDTQHIGHKNPFRYRGYYYDTETGLYYLKSRYYDPETCRFINMDSVEYADPTYLHGLNLYAYCNNNPIMYVDPNGHDWETFWNSVGNWFSEHWKEVVVGTGFIVAGALVSAFTAGAGVGFMAAFGSALLSSATQVGISIGTSILVGGLSSVISGGNFFDNIGDNIANAYMWGGIFSGSAQILGGGFRIAANQGVATGRKGGIKLGNFNIKILSPDKNNWTKAGGTLIKFGNSFRLDIGAMWGMHMHIRNSGHIPIGAILAGLIGNEY